jgi:polysaccharide export outer membrane protein
MVSVRSALLVCLLAATTACASGGDRPVIATGERYQAQTLNEYRVGTGDKVRMNVAFEQGLSGEFTVNAAGNVALPLIGEVPARGRTVQEIAADAQGRYGAGYLRQPHVVMEVTAYRPFYVLGEVTTPGQYPYQVGITALNAIATAHGFTPRADKRVLHIRREGAAEEEPYAVTPALRIYPGDTVRVGERFF